MCCDQKWDCHGSECNFFALFRASQQLSIIFLSTTTRTANSCENSDELHRWSGDGKLWVMEVWAVDECEENSAPNYGALNPNPPPIYERR